MAERATPRASAYVAAKNAQIGLTKVWAKELGADGITVNLIQPGWIPVERHAGIDTDPLRIRSAAATERESRTTSPPWWRTSPLTQEASSPARRITVNGGHMM